MVVFPGEDGAGFTAARTAFQIIDYFYASSAFSSITKMTVCWALRAAKIVADLLNTAPKCILRRHR